MPHCCCGLSAHAVGGFYHDGRFATLEALIEHYDALFGLALSEAEKGDLVHYLRSI